MYLGVVIVGFTPLPCGHSPYIPLWKHRGRGLEVVFQFRYKDSIVNFSPVRMVAPHPAMLRDAAGERLRFDFIAVAVAVF